MEEVEHVIEVLEGVEKALLEKDAVKLRELSNQTIHSASAFQDTGSITIAVLVYTLSKLIERKDYEKIEGWSAFEKQSASFIESAVKSLKKNNIKDYENSLLRVRQALSAVSVDLKPYIQEVLRKGSVNKASKLYEHGLSLGRTAYLLGLTEWELSEYTGQIQVSDIDYNRTIDTKKRVKTAMEFFK